MNYCKIRSYNAIRAAMFGKKLTMTQRIILLRSQPHTHTEFQFSEKYNFISFSATMAEGAKCARFKQIEYSHEAERWDTVIVPMTTKWQERNIHSEAMKLEGTPYDLVGQLSHISKLRIWKPSKKKIWCTKAVAELIYAAKPSFFDFLQKFKLTNELRPDQLDFMARYYFEYMYGDCKVVK